MIQIRGSYDNHPVIKICDEVIGEVRLKERALPRGPWQHRVRSRVHTCRDDDLSIREVKPHERTCMDLLRSGTGRLSHALNTYERLVNLLTLEKEEP